jgi:hypothetical protein
MTRDMPLNHSSGNPSNSDFASRRVFTSPATPCAVVLTGGGSGATDGAIVLGAANRL